MITVRLKGGKGTVEVEADQKLVYSPNWKKYEPVETVSGVLHAALRTYKEMPE